MNDPRRSEWSDPTHQANAGYPPNTDPAYAGQYPDAYYNPTSYGTPTYATQPLPPYWQQGGGYPPAEPPQPPPGPPRSPRWLWIVAVAAVLLVVGLVIALGIVSSSSRESTVVAPLPSLPENTTTTPRTTTTRVPIPTTTIPSPTITAPNPPLTPNETTAPGSTDTVVYDVSGEGRAINITYVDTGGVMQTEFNVLLPWSKEVSLSSPARSSASVAIVNVGRDVTCSVSVNGVQVRQRTGRGLTICTAVG